MPKYQQTVRAPEFGAGHEWLNTDQPLTLEQLRGKVVLLDFWTYCCINCMHVLPKLAGLEEKYSDGLVVIGVHSAKFQDEGATDNIRQAILRNNISHPVVNDRRFEIWKTYAVQAWPTMVLIDPDGYVVSTQSGESAPDLFDPYIAALIAHYEQLGRLDRTALHLVLERDSTPPSLLSFPSKVRVDETSDRLFIADTNHNRVIVARRSTGEVQAVIGNGKKGLDNGTFEDATFYAPQGLELVGDILYIADTQNHALRAADLTQQTVNTVAGTGEQGGYGHGAGNALNTPLSSPWDLVWDGNRLFIAMAGPHQIWYYDPATQQVGVWAGTGREDIVDAPLKQAALAQPSGITFDGKNWLYFADSEVSAIRGAQDDENGLVSTVIGHGLFEFGDIDGDRLKARFQHPLGVAWHDSLLYVADTYNNKIKLVDPGTRTSKTWAGSGMGGYKDGPKDKARFDEPGGIDVASDGTVYLADTNNHAVRVIDPESGEVSTFTFTGLETMMVVEDEIDLSTAIVLDPKLIRGGANELQLQLIFPDGFKLNDGGGLQVTLNGAASTVVDLFTTRLPCTIPVTVPDHTDAITIRLRYVYCRKGNEGLCYFGDTVLKLPVTVNGMKAAGDEPIIVSYRVPRPEQ